MDFSTLDLGIAKDKKAQATETTVETGLKIDGKPVKNGAGKNLKLTLLAPGTPEATQEWRKWEKKFAIGRVVDHIEATEDELTDLVQRDDQAAYDLAARLVCGWNVEGPDGAPAECNRENREAFFKAHEAAAIAVMVRAQELAREAGNSKAA